MVIFLLLVVCCKSETMIGQQIFQLCHNYYYEIIRPLRTLTFHKGIYQNHVGLSFSCFMLNHKCGIPLDVKAYLFIYLHIDAMILNFLKEAYLTEWGK